MKILLIAVVLTAINIVIMTFLLTQIRPAQAQQQHTHDLPVLRGRALEIVDNNGRVRASITIQPPVETAGRKYPETVLLRLIEPNGKPLVKIGAADNGAGLSLINQSDEGVIIHGHNDGSYVKMTNKGKERVFRP